MKMKRPLGWITIALAVLTLPSTVRADVVWPALYLEQRLLSVPVIVMGLLIEALTLHYTFAMDWKRASAASFVVNSVSTIAGILLIPLAGVLWEIFPGLILYKLLDVGTFNPTTWTATFFLALWVTTGIEVVSLRRWFGIHSNRRTWLLWSLANIVTVGLAFASLITWPTLP